MFQVLQELVSNNPHGYYSMFENYLSVKFLIVYKRVSWFAKQIHQLVSIWEIQGRYNNWKVQGGYNNNVRFIAMPD